MEGKRISDSIADFEILANDLKCFHSVLLYYDVNLEYFSGEVVKEILGQWLLDKMCAERTNPMSAKEYADDTSKYLPRLSNREHDKITFRQTDLGSNLLQNKNKNVNIKKVFSNDVRVWKKNQTWIVITKILELLTRIMQIRMTDRIVKKQCCIFCGEKGHKSLFDCHKFKDADPTNRFRFRRSYWLCWRCMEREHYLRNANIKKLKLATDTFIMNWFVPVSIKEKNYFSSFISQYIFP